MTMPSTLAGSGQGFAVLTPNAGPAQARGMNGFRDSDAMPSHDDDADEHVEEDDRSHWSNPSPGHSHHRGQHYASTNRCNC